MWLAVPRNFLTGCSKNRFGSCLKQKNSRNLSVLSVSTDISETSRNSLERVQMKSHQACDSQKMHGRVCSLLSATSPILDYSNGLVVHSYSGTSAMELPESCTKPSISVQPWQHTHDKRVAMMRDADSYLSNMKPIKYAKNILTGR